MNRTRRMAAVAIFAVLCLILGNVSTANVQAPAAGQDTGVTKAPPYTMAEYNAYKACEGEANAGQKVKCLDDFVSKYPNSGLLNFVYQKYEEGYGQLKNYRKVIENADKLAAMGSKIEPGVLFNAYYTHCAAYNALISDPSPESKPAANDATLAKAAQAAAASALKSLDDVKKPDGVTDDAWQKQVAQFRLFLNGVTAQASMIAHDYAAAVSAYKAALAMNPDDAISSYRLGLAYNSMTPPQTIDAFWAIARAVTSKGATQAQSAKVKEYLRKLIVNYQGGTVCDSLTDAELSELLQLASSSPDRPSSYSIPRAADLAAAQKDMTIASVITDLKAGGDKGKLTWFASCGLEFPEVPGKVIEVVPGTDSILLKIAFVTSDAEFDAATTPNMDVKVVGQPDAARVEKDSAIHFTGTLVSYDPDPAFFLHWDKAKVKEEDLPKAKEKAPAKKPVRRPPAKKPSGG